MQQIALERYQRSSTRGLQTELIRKAIHLSIAFTPAIASLVGTATTLVLLGAGIILYTVAETQRQRGRTVPIISRLTELSARRRDQNRFVLGPVTLGIGAMLALMLYPDPAATIAIYALAFGDGIASVAGKLYGRTVIPFTRGKTVEGSLSCTVAVAAAAYAVYPHPAVVAAGAVSATALEMLPTGDADNLILPVGVGLVVALMV